MHKDAEKATPKQKNPPTEAPISLDTQVVVDDTNRDVFVRVWQEASELMRQKLRDDFGITDDFSVEQMVTGVTRTGLFEDLINGGIGAIVSNLSSGAYDIMDQLVESGLKVWTFEERLRHYANYPVRRKKMAADKYEELVRYLREEIYYTPKIQEYDEKTVEIRSIIEELKAKKMKRSERIKKYDELLEKAKYIAESVIANKIPVPISKNH